MSTVNELLETIGSLQKDLQEAEDHIEHLHRELHTARRRAEVAERALKTLEELALKRAHEALQAKLEPLTKPPED